MKLLQLILFLLLSQFLYAQKWVYDISENKFDGDSKYAYVIGTGDKFPYNTPRLYVNYFIDEKSLNIYIAKGGYSGCPNNLIYVIFEGEDQKYIFNASSNSENDIWFFKESLNTYSSSISFFDMFEKMKAYKTMYVRLVNDCYQTDLIFSLNGSSPAINFVAAEYIADYETAQIEILKKEIEDKKLKDEEQEVIKTKEQKILGGAKLKAKTAYACSFYPATNSTTIINTLTKGEEVIIQYFNKDYYILINSTSVQIGEKKYFIKSSGIVNSSIEVIE